MISCFSRLNPSEAPGPDGLKGRVIKVCAPWLGPMFACLFHFFLYSMSVPRARKSSIIIPVPKKPNVKQMKSREDVALTSILAKCTERVVYNQLVASVADRMDPLQFAYKARRGVEDACRVLVSLISSHLDQSGSYVRVMSMDL